MTGTNRHQTRHRFSAPADIAQRREELETDLLAFALVEREWALKRANRELAARLFASRVSLGLLVIVVAISLARGATWLPPLASAPSARSPVSPEASLGSQTLARAHEGPSASSNRPHGLRPTHYLDREPSRAKGASPPTLLAHAQPATESAPSRTVHTTTTSVPSLSHTRAFARGRARDAARNSRGP